MNQLHTEPSTMWIASNVPDMRKEREALRGVPARDLTGSFINILATPLDNDPGGEVVYSNSGYMTASRSTPTLMIRCQATLTATTSEMPGT